MKSLEIVNERIREITKFRDFEQYPDYLGVYNSLKQIKKDLED